MLKYSWQTDVRSLLTIRVSPTGVTIESVRMTSYTSVQIKSGHINIQHSQTSTYFWLWLTMLQWSEEQRCYLLSLSSVKLKYQNSLFWRSSKSKVFVNAILLNWIKICPLYFFYLKQEWWVRIWGLGKLWHHPALCIVSGILNQAPP